MPDVDLGQLLESSGAILKGHFVLTSGRHSDTYFEKFRVLEQPSVLSQLCSQIVEGFANIQFDVVLGPTTGGIIIAFEVARQMGLPALYAESEEGVRKLRRGAHLEAGARVLIVDDVLTTGRSILEVRDIVKRSGANLHGVGVLIDRTEKRIDFGCPLVSAYRVEATSYADDAVPDWLAAIPTTKPGTRVERR